MFCTFFRSLGSRTACSPFRKHKACLKCRPEVEALEQRIALSFSSPIGLPNVSGNDAVKVQSADFNGDNIVDLVVGKSLSSGGQLDVYLSPSRPGCSLSTSRSSTHQITDLAVGDLNSDGKMDVITAGGKAAVMVYLGNGDGTLQSGRAVDLPSGPRKSTQISRNVALGDLNDDGNLDLAVGSWTTRYRPAGRRLDVLSTMVTSMIGRGNGTFQTAGKVTLVELFFADPPYTPVPVGIGDLSGLGKADVGVATQASFGGTADGNAFVYVLRGDGTGNLQGIDPQRDYVTSGWGPASLAVSDLNGDRVSELAVAFGSTGYYGNNSVQVFVRDLSSLEASGPPWRAFTFTTNSNFPNSIHLADVNTDGMFDIITSDYSGGVQTLINDSPPSSWYSVSFRPVQSFATETRFTEFTTADLNGDDAVDLVLIDGISAFQSYNDRLW